MKFVQELKVADGLEGMGLTSDPKVDGLDDMGLSSGPRVDRVEGMSLFGGPRVDGRPSQIWVC
jgi:hypothetical protein